MEREKYARASGHLYLISSLCFPSYCFFLKFFFNALSVTVRLSGLGSCSVFCKIEKGLTFLVFIFAPKLTAGHSCFRSLRARRLHSNPRSGINKPLNQTLELKRLQKKIWRGIAA